MGRQLTQLREPIDERFDFFAPLRGLGFLRDDILRHRLDLVVERGDIDGEVCHDMLAECG